MIKRPTTTFAGRRMRWSAVALVGSVLLAGCGVATTPSVSTQPSASAPVLVPLGPPGPAPTGSPVEAVGTTFDIVEGRLVTSCFSYAVPAGYSVDGSSAQCSTAIRADENGMTDINVFASTGIDTIDAFFETVTTNAQANQLGDVTTKLVTVQGRDAGVVYYYGAYGIPTAIYYIPIQPGYYTVNGAPVTAITASGPIASSASADILQGILDSLEFPG